MLEQNAEKILSSLKESDLVLDIGAWAQPFNRANYVIDFMPFETRGLFGSRGGTRECFTKATWVQRDICSREPFPFHDKQFDFVICSHTLEDVRDPIWICQEMSRVGKRGYIETPSRLLESTRGVELPTHSGYWHHRWFVELIDGELIFTAKFPLIDTHWKYHLPSHVYPKLKENEKFFCYFWQNHFRAREKVFPFQLDGVTNDYETFVSKHCGWPSYRYRLSKFREWYRDSKVRKKWQPLLGFIEKPIKFILKES